MKRDLKVLSGLFGASGVLHLVRPRPYESIVPRPLPRKRELVYASGVAEIALAAMMLHPRTRRLGGLGAASLLVAVFPANVQMTLDAARDDRKPWWFTAGTVARLPLQLPMIRAALRAARG